MTPFLCHITLLLSGAAQAASLRREATVVGQQGGERSNPDHPQVCLDETSKQLISEVCQLLPCRPGEPHRYEAHCKREGVCQLFMLYEPLAGWRHVTVCERKGAVEWAAVIAELLEVRYPKAKKVRL